MEMAFGLERSSISEASRACGEGEYGFGFLYLLCPQSGLQAVRFWPMLVTSQCGLSSTTLGTRRYQKDQQRGRLGSSVWSQLIKAHAAAPGQHYDEDRAACIVEQDLLTSTKPYRTSFAGQGSSSSCKKKPQQRVWCWIRDFSDMRACWECRSGTDFPKQGVTTRDTFNGSGDK